MIVNYIYFIQNNESIQIQFTYMHKNFLQSKFQSANISNILELEGSLTNNSASLYLLCQNTLLGNPLEQRFQSPTFKYYGHVN